MNYFKVFINNKHYFLVDHAIYSTYDSLIRYYLINCSKNQLNWQQILLNKIRCKDDNYIEIRRCQDFGTVVPTITYSIYFSGSLKFLTKLYKLYSKNEKFKTEQDAKDNLEKFIKVYKNYLIFM